MAASAGMGSELESPARRHSGGFRAKRTPGRFPLAGRRGRDSNPRGLRPGVFKTPTLNRSDTPPREPPRILPSPRAGGQRSEPAYCALSVIGWPLIVGYILATWPL